VVENPCVNLIGVRYVRIKNIMAIVQDVVFIYFQIFKFLEIIKQKKLAFEIMF
jgi:hypothetical protein